MRSAMTDSILKVIHIRLINSVEASCPICPPNSFVRGFRMGQQQILLIILGVIVVGVAVTVGITMFQDNAIDHNRAAVIGDLKKLAIKAQQYYSRPTSLGGGGNTFTALTADATGLAQLATTAFTDNANGTYTIKVAGTSTDITFEGVGKTELSDGTFPTYDMAVTASTQIPVKLN